MFWFYAKRQHFTKLFQNSPLFVLLYQCHADEWCQTGSSPQSMGNACLPRAHTPCPWERSSWGEGTSEVIVLGGRLLPKMLISPCCLSPWRTKTCLPFPLLTSLAVEDQSTTMEKNNLSSFSLSNTLAHGKKELHPKHKLWTPVQRLHKPSLQHLLNSAFTQSLCRCDSSPVGPRQSFPSLTVQLLKNPALAMAPDLN